MSFQPTALRAAAELDRSESMGDCMRSLIVGITCLMLAGCLSGPAGSPADEGSFAASWEPGIFALLATTTYMSHAGKGSITAVPAWNGTQPEYCVIFRDGIAHEDDQCVVQPGPTWHVESPWHVSASFNGSGYPIDDGRRWSEKTIEAYDHMDALVGFWDGLYHEKHVRAIE